MKKKCFLGQNMCLVSRVQTDTHESEYRGHHFRVSRFFPSTYHQGSVKKMLTQKRGLEISTKSI